MGCASSCEADESTLNCGVGSCSIKHCGGKVKEEHQAAPSEAELVLRLAERAHAQKAIDEALATHGKLPTFAELQEMMSKKMPVENNHFPVTTPVAATAQ